jgi:beta-lactamase class A
MRNILLLAVTLLCFGWAVCAAATEKTSKWIREIVRLEAQYGGHLGFMAKNLKTGETLSYRASERFPTASAIKLPVLAAYFQLVDEHRIDPDEVITLKREEIKPGSEILRLFTAGDRITLSDAAKLMIVQSDNTATNLVLDRLAASHNARLSVVNDFLVRKGLRNTRLLNRLYSPETKQSTPEAVRYGIGVSTPEDMILLLELLYAKTLVSAPSCDAMLTILRQQSERAMIPRFLPEDECKFIEIGNKTGSVNETKVDVALILSDKADIAVAAFVDKSPDHRGDVENRAILLGATAARAAWNYFTGSSGLQERKVPDNDVDWNVFPGGSWGIFRSAAAPFPHPARRRGAKLAGESYPFHPHYDDSSIVVVVPDSFQETSGGANLIVHFHGQMSDNMEALEIFEMPQSLSARRTNAILVLPQGPYRAPDSFGGKMEDAGGFERLIKDVLATLQKEKILKSAQMGQLILSADGAGGRAAAVALKRGGLAHRVSSVFLMDALPKDREIFREWLAKGEGNLYGTCTPAGEKESRSFEQSLPPEAKLRLHLTVSALDHEALVRAFFASWLPEGK